MAETFVWLAKHFDTSRVAGVGHRVVHGGDFFAGPARIDESTIKAIDKLTLLAPLHQPHSLRLIRALLPRFCWRKLVTPLPFSLLRLLPKKKKRMTRPRKRSRVAPTLDRHKTTAYSSEARPGNFQIECKVQRKQVSSHWG